MQSAPAPRQGLSKRAILDFRQFLFEQLLVVELGVISPSCDQFFMATEFYDATAVYDGDAIRVSDRRYAVRDEYCSSPLHDLTQVVQYPVFRLGIYAGQRIV